MKLIDDMRREVKPFEFVCASFGFIALALTLPFVLISGGPFDGWGSARCLWVVAGSPDRADMKFAVNLDGPQAIGISGLSFMVRAWIVFGRALRGRQELRPDRGPGGRRRLPRRLHLRPGGPDDAPRPAHEDRPDGGPPRESLASLARARARRAPHDPSLPAMAEAVAGETEKFNPTLEFKLDRLRPDPHRSARPLDQQGRHLHAISAADRVHRLRDLRDPRWAQDAADQGPEHRRDRLRVRREEHHPGDPAREVLHRGGSRTSRRSSCSSG